ncbi:hypothetical protein EZS27_029228 [termite gut metagenome]|uniref:HTH cro/C1-type domain-containing protein n=1 Tax=termite gut metagenome TaxID=433724 RepID=A0A5J4QIF4_9ZZZZ
MKTERNDEMNLEGDGQIRDYSAVLAAEYGAPGTPERAKFDEEAYAFYTSQILLDARKNARLTQAQLAERIGANKSYISKIENGVTVPTVATFYRIANALGLNVELTPSTS